MTINNLVEFERERTKQDIEFSRRNNCTLLQVAIKLSGDKQND